MNYNYHIIYEVVNDYSWWARRIIRFVIYDKNYFYHLFIFNPIEIYQYLPLQPYLNNTGFKL